MFGTKSKPSVEMILDVHVDCGRLIRVLIEKYDMTWDDIEDNDCSVNFQILKVGSDELLNFNNKLSYNTGGLLKKIIKVNESSCLKLVEGTDINIERTPKSTNNLHLFYLGIGGGGLSLSMLCIDENMDKDIEMCTFPLFEFIEMNNEGHMKYKNLNWDERGKKNLSDIQRVLGDNWDVRKRYVQDCPRVSWEEVVEVPYEDYNIENDFFYIGLKFQYSDSEG